MLEAASSLRVCGGVPSSVTTGSRPPVADDKLLARRWYCC